MTGDRQRQYLNALGISLWLPRGPLAGGPVETCPPESSNHPGASRHPALAKEGNIQERLPPAPMIDGEEPELSPPLDWAPPLDDAWEPVTELDHADLPSPPASSREARIAGMGWEELTAEARQCRACGLCATRAQVVFGVGDRRAEWLIVGEAPGADEDRLGEPFVGRAGKLLNPMLLAIGLRREQVYIANILKCRPPENREPTPGEAACCRPFLERQIALIRPRIILAVGRIAAQNLLDTDTQIGKLRGRAHRFGPTRIPLVVTYHPAYLLRSPREKRKSWDDLRLARRALAAEPARLPGEPPPP
jgi:DNA polymerase